MRILIIAIILTFAVAVSGQTTFFKLSGKHTFTKSGAKTWQVSKEEIDPKTGKKNLKENVLEKSGESISIDLKPSGNKETIYYLKSEGDGFSEIKKVRVFKPWKLSSFTFKSKSNPDVRTFIVFPKKLSSETRVLFIMHGLNPRKPDLNMESWLSWASRYNYILVGPHFDEVNWAKSRSYTLGNLFTGNEGKGDPNPPENWSFRVVENIFSELKNGVDSSISYYDMFGHSSGAQFVQRFTFFMPGSRVRLAIAANAGWYTLPDLNTKFPYGLKHPKLNLSEAHLESWSKKYLLIMRGTKNTKRTKQVRQTKLADAQGPNRFERAGHMFKMMKNKYPKTNWRLIDAPDVGHSHSKMAQMARIILQRLNQPSQKK